MGHRHRLPPDEIAAQEAAAATYAHAEREWRAAAGSAPTAYQREVLRSLRVARVRNRRGDQADRWERPSVAEDLPDGLG